MVYDRSEVYAKVGEIRVTADFGRYKPGIYVDYSFVAWAYDSTALAKVSLQKTSG